MAGEAEMTFMEHLEELRQRILYCLYSIVPAVILCFIFVRQLLLFLTRHAQKHNVPVHSAGAPAGQSAQEFPIDFYLSPIHGPLFKINFDALEKVSSGNPAAASNPLPAPETILQALSPTETVIAYMKVAFVSALFLVFPFIMYQVWRFIEPGLKSNEKKYLGPFILSTWLFFIFGGLFAYFGMLPVAIPLLAQFGEGIVRQAWSLSAYVSFVLKMLLAFGIVFELPVLAALLSMMGIVTPSFLARYRRHSIVIIVIVAAFLTPPDPVTQMFMAVPLYMLYELSIFVSKIFQRKPEPASTVARNE